MIKHVPNILTIIRFFLIPFILFFIFLGKDETGNIELDTVNAATNSKEVLALTKPYDLPSN